MAERTLTISSAGKTFSFTGWKIGWVCGPEELVTAVRTAKQFITYVNGAPFQPAIARRPRPGRRRSTSSWRDTLQAKRDVLCDGLRAAGFDVFVPQGTYFATVDIRSVGGDDGLEFCRALPERCGVVAVPSSVFYEDPATGRHLVRFAFCKRTEVLTEAAERLAGAQGDADRDARIAVRGRRQHDALAAGGAVRPRDRERDGGERDRPARELLGQHERVQREPQQQHEA